MAAEAGKVEDPQLVLALARAAVERAAPEELPLFPATGAAFVADPDAVERRVEREETLGFGIEIAAALAPYALAVARAVIKFVYEQVAAAAREEGEKAIREKVKAIFARLGGKKPDTEVPALSPEQLGEVRATAIAKARELGLDEARGNLLADAMVGTLVTS